MPTAPVCAMPAPWPLPPPYTRHPVSAPDEFVTGSITNRLLFSSVGTPDALMYCSDERMAPLLSVNVPCCVTYSIFVTRPEVERPRTLMAVTFPTGWLAKSPITQLICAIVQL